MFLMTEMIVVGSNYWNFGFGMNEGDVLKDAEAINNMHNLATNIAWVAKRLYA